MTTPREAAKAARETIANELAPLIHTLPEVKATYPAPLHGRTFYGGIVIQISQARRIIVSMTKAGEYEATWEEFVGDTITRHREAAPTLAHLAQIIAERASLSC